MRTTELSKIKYEKQILELDQAQNKIAPSIVEAADEKKELSRLPDDNAQTIDEINTLRDLTDQRIKTLDLLSFDMPCLEISKRKPDKTLNSIESLIKQFKMTAKDLDVEVKQITASFQTLLKKLNKYLYNGVGHISQTVLSNLKIIHAFRIRIKNYLDELETKRSQIIKMSLRKLTLLELDDKILKTQDKKDFKLIQLCTEIAIEKFEQQWKTCSPKDIALLTTNILNSYANRCISGLLVYAEELEINIEAANLILEQAKKHIEITVDRIPVGSRVEKTNELLSGLLSLIAIYKTKLLKQSDYQQLIRTKVVLQVLLDYLNERINDVNLILMYTLLYEISTSIDDENESKKILDTLLKALDKKSCNPIFLKTVIETTAGLVNCLGDNDLDTNEKLYILFSKATLQIGDVTATATLFQTLYDDMKQKSNTDDAGAADYLYHKIIEKIIYQGNIPKETYVEGLIKVLEELDPQPINIIKQLSCMINKASLHDNKKEHISDLKEPQSKRQPLKDPEFKKQELDKQAILSDVTTAQLLFEEPKMRIENQVIDSKETISIHNKNLKVEKHKKKKNKIKQKNEKNFESASWQLKIEQSIQIKNARAQEIQNFKNNISFIKKNNALTLAEVTNMPNQVITSINLTLSKLENCTKEYHALAAKISNSISEIETLLKDMSVETVQPTFGHAISLNKSYLETQLKALASDLDKIIQTKQSLTQAQKSAEQRLKDHILKRYETLLSNAETGYMAIKAKLNQFKHAMEQKLKLRPLDKNETMILLETKQSEMIYAVKCHQESIRNTLDASNPDVDDSNNRDSFEQLVKSKKEEVSNKVNQIESAITQDIEKFTVSAMAKLNQIAKPAQADIEKRNRTREKNRERFLKERARKNVIRFLKYQLTLLVGQLNSVDQLIRINIQNFGQLNLSIFNIELAVKSLVQSINDYLSFLKKAETEFTLSSDPAVIDIKMQLELISQQQNAQNKKLFLLKKISKFHDNCYQIKRTVQNIFSFYTTAQSATMASFETTFHDNIKNKNIAIKKLIEEMTANYNLATLKLSNAEKQWKSVKDSYQKDISQSNLSYVFLLQSCVNILNTTENQFNSIAVNLYLKQHELKQNQLNSFTNRLSELHKDTPFDYVQSLQTTLNEKIILKGGIIIFGGECLYNSPEIAAFIGLKDIDGTIFTKTDDAYEHLVRRLLREGFIIRDSRDPKFKNLVKNVNGTEIDLTIAAPNYEGNQIISPLVSGITGLILNDEEFKLGSDRYECIQKINDNYIICIDKSAPHYEDFKLACQGKLEGYIPYNPNIHSNYCNLVLKCHRKSVLIKGDNHFQDPPDRYLSFRQMLTHLEVQFFLLLNSKYIDDQKKPDDEIKKVLKENNGLNAATRPFLRAYLGARIRHLNAMYGNFFKDKEFIAKIVTKILSKLNKSRNEHDGPTTIEWVKQIADEVFQSKIDLYSFGYEPTWSSVMYSNQLLFWSLPCSNALPSISPSYQPAGGVYYPGVPSQMSPDQAVPPSSQRKKVQPVRDERSPLRSLSVLNGPTRFKATGLNPKAEAFKPRQPSGSAQS